MNRIIKFVCLLSFAALLAGVLAACQPQPGAPAGTPPPKATAAVPAKATWQEDWENTVAAARKEGTLVVYVVHGPEFRVPVARAFKEKFGIDTDWVVGITDLLPKLLKERRAGLYLGDVMISGATTLQNLNAEGAADAIEPALVLPEVTDPAQWLGGKLHFLDNDRRSLAFYSRTGSTIMVNTEIVKAEDFKSYRDLLSPKWKGEIVINDPTGVGGGARVSTVMHVLLGPDFLRELAKQEPMITRDQRQQVEWVARGRYAILLGPGTTNMAEFRKVGAPIRHVIPTEGTWSGAGGGTISMIKNAAHPAAARVFLNWFLSREGQTVAVKAAQEQSRRLDVSPEYIEEDRRLQPGVNYVDGDSESFIQKIEETRALVREVFSAQMK